MVEGARVIEDYPLVSPCDATVVNDGEVLNDDLEHIKGRNYSLTQFLYGKKMDANYYLNSLKSNKDSKLYQFTLYLGPSYYHRFHSPTDWNIVFRRHLFGYLLGVFELNLWRKKDIFSINERVAYFGNWEHGFLGYVAVGAFNVGSIQIHIDPELKTNDILTDG